MDNDYQNPDCESRLDDQIKSELYSYSIDYIWWTGIIVFGSMGLLFLALT